MAQARHQTLKRYHRLIKTDEFSSVFDFKKRVNGHYFMLHYQPNKLGFSRLGLVVGKRVQKSAVKRNYMRRILRELFRTHESRMLLSYDFVIRVTKQFNQRDFNDVNKQYQRIINQISKKQFDRS